MLLELATCTCIYTHVHMQAKRDYKENDILKARKNIDRAKWTICTSYILCFVVLVVTITVIGVTLNRLES